jgi:hypothetical protein
MIPRTVAATVGALLVAFTASSASAQEARPESPTKDIPERYSREVAPAPGTLWRAPDLRDYSRLLKSTEGRSSSQQALQAPVIDSAPSA